MERIELEEEEVAMNFTFPPPPPSAHCVAKLERSAQRYGELTVFENFDFEITRGQKIAVVGPNGAGKSTTMKMVTGFVPPSAGRVSVCGLDIDQASLEARRCIGYGDEWA